MSGSPQKSSRDISKVKDYSRSVTGGRKKNSKNPPITQEEVRLAFEFLDTEKKGYITMQNLRDRLGVFYRNLSTKDYKLLLNHKSELYPQDLYNLLVDSDLGDFDPMYEAFKIFAPSDSDCIEQETVTDLLKSLGFVNLSEEDIFALLAAMDLNNDRLVDYSDFVGLVKSNGTAMKTKNTTTGTTSSNTTNTQQQQQQRDRFK